MGKCLSIKVRNLHPMLVFKFWLYGGLNHIIFRDLFRRWDALNLGSLLGRYSMLVLKPLFLSVSLYMDAALLKVAWSDDNFDSLAYGFWDLFDRV